MSVHNFTPAAFLPANGRRYGDRPEEPSSRPSRRWAYIVVALLATHLLAMGAAMLIATRSRYEVVPDYYERAVNWDRDRAAAGSFGDLASPTTRPATP